MNEPRDPNETLAAGTDPDAPDEAANPTIDLGSLPDDSLELGLAAAFGKTPGPPRSSFGNMRQVLLKEAEGESSLVVTPRSDAMPAKNEAGLLSPAKLLVAAWRRTSALQRESSLPQPL